MTGGALGRFLACFEKNPVAGSLVGFELAGVTGAAEGRDLIAGGDAVWGGVAGCLTVLFAFAVAGVAGNAFGEVRVGLDLGGWLCVALLAELMLLGQEEEKQ
jgi:hypothetical protein